MPAQMFHMKHLFANEAKRKEPAGSLLQTVGVERAIYSPDSV